MNETANLEVWARETIEKQITAAADALACYCRKPQSAKRLHSARKALARLRTCLEDLGVLAGVTPDFRERVQQLHQRAGKARDGDVQIQRVDDYLENAAQDECEQLQVVRAILRKRRKRARRRLDQLVRNLPELHA